MSLTEKRKKQLAAQKRRALMKEIDKREAAEQEGVGFSPFYGMNAKRALKTAYKQNEIADFENFRDRTPTYEGLERDLINIKKYGDDAMRSKGFGSRQAKAEGGMVKKRYMDGGCVMGNRGVRNTNMS